MRLRKISILAAMCLFGSMLLTGCSFSGTLDKILGHTEKVVEGDAEKEVKKEVKVVDSTLESPSFTVNLEGSVNYAVGMEASPLSVEAVVNDGGNVTYQWYYNNVNANGGGERVEGQTGNTCVPDTTELGTWYYYVVAINNHDDHIAMATSNTIEIKVVPEGNWVNVEGYPKYQLYDGSFVTNGWRDIDGQRYAFDENGYLRYGWFKDSDEMWYYLNPDGTMARDAEIDGYAIDSNGVSADKRLAELEEAERAAQVLGQ